MTTEASKERRRRMPSMTAVTQVVRGVTAAGVGIARVETLMKTTKSGAISMAGELGFEPRLTESESAVLPLNYSPILSGSNTTCTRQKFAGPAVAVPS